MPLEDILFTYYLHHYGKKFGFINKIGYYYYDNNEGLTNKYTINDKKTIINNVLTVLKDDEIDEEYKFYVGYYSLLFLPFDYTYNITNYKTIKEIINEYFKFIDKNRFMDKLKSEKILYYVYYKCIIEGCFYGIDLFKGDD